MLPQQEEGQNDINELIGIGYGVDANHDGILPLTSIEQVVQTSLREATNQQARRSTQE